MEERPILRLDEEIIGKIAAGEVVESPASAVKELVENSLDAGATSVTIEIRDGGISYLRVTDNGRGIPNRDVRLAFERHATSKIRRSSDLFDLHTLGFRGEALASIAAVSKLTLTTRYAREDTGTRAVCEGGVIKSIQEAASPQGTTIVARELFFNTPVRLKFLKKPVTEAAKVAEVISRLILSRPDVSLRLINNGKQLYFSSGNGELRSAVFCLYGRETANAMTQVHSEGAVSVNGLVGIGALARSNRSRQTFIVNGRTIRSPLLTQALEEACRERFTVGHYPICVLNIEMPASMVDVNVHPNKLEVRFSDEHLIFENVRGAVADSFSVSPIDNAPKMTLAPEDETPALRPGVVQVIDTQTEEGAQQARQALRDAVATGAEIPEASDQSAAVAAQAQSAAAEAADRDTQEKTSVPPNPLQHSQFTSFVTQYFGGAALRERVVPGTPPKDIGFMPLEGRKSAKSLAKPEAQENMPAAQEAEPEKPIDRPQGAQEQPQPVQETLFPGEEQQDLGAELSGYSMVGVAFDTYIILQNRDQILFIDQHAAHERILYERLMREIDAGGGSQVLMTPQVVHVTPQDRAKIEVYAEEIRAAGYDVEPFGDNAFQLRAVPNVLGVPQGRDVFIDLLDNLGELRVLATQQKRRDAILQMACKKAVKGGDRLSMQEIRPLLKDMIATGTPPTCPHGRPLVVALTRSELEKRFRRINN